MILRILSMMGSARWISDVICARCGSYAKRFEKYMAMLCQD